MDLVEKLIFNLKFNLKSNQLVLIGALLPVPVWFFVGKKPNQKWIELINLGVLLVLFLQPECEPLESSFLHLQQVIVGSPHLHSLSCIRFRTCFHGCASLLRPPNLWPFRSNLVGCRCCPSLSDTHHHLRKFPSSSS